MSSADDHIARSCGKRISLILLVFLGMALGARAQVQVGLSLEDRLVMENEAAVVKVLVQNDSDTPLVFNKVYHNAELFLAVYRASSRNEPEYQVLDRELVIMPDDAITELVELTSLINMRQPGAYMVRARVRYDGRIFASRPQAFDVIHGIEIASRQRLLTGYRSQHVRYSLRYSSRGSSEYAFLVATDPDRDVSFGTFKLGPIVRVSPPAMRFDAKGRLIVAHQSGRNRFTRSVISVTRDGAVLEAQTHHLPDGKPYPEKREK
jgi:hypothetical protein